MGQDAAFYPQFIGATGRRCSSQAYRQAVALCLGEGGAPQGAASNIFQAMLLRREGLRHWRDFSEQQRRKRAVYIMCANYCCTRLQRVMLVHWHAALRRPNPLAHVAFHLAAEQLTYKAVATFAAWRRLAGLQSSAALAGEALAARRRLCVWSAWCRAYWCQQTAAALAQRRDRTMSADCLIAWWYHAGDRRARGRKALVAAAALRAARQRGWVERWSGARTWRRMWALAETWHLRATRPRLRCALNIWASHVSRRRRAANATLSLLCRRASRHLKVWAALLRALDLHAGASVQAVFRSWRRLARQGLVKTRIDEMWEQG